MCGCVCVYICVRVRVCVCVCVWVLEEVVCILVFTGGQMRVRSKHPLTDLSEWEAADPPVAPAPPPPADPPPPPPVDPAPREDSMIETDWEWLLLRWPLEVSRGL